MKPRELLLLIAVAPAVVVLGACGGDDPVPTPTPTPPPSDEPSDAPTAEPTVTPHITPLPGETVDDPTVWGISVSLFIILVAAATVAIVLLAGVFWALVVAHDRHTTFGAIIKSIFKPYKAESSADNSSDNGGETVAETVDTAAENNEITAENTETNNHVKGDDERSESDE